MTPEAQRIAIAEWCGWKICDKGKQGPLWWAAPNGELETSCPDFLNDLNAMHEAVAKLDFGVDRFIWWMEHLLKIGHRKNDCEHRPSDDLKIVQATASQRVEALLRTIGKWQDDPTPVLVKDK